MAYVACCTSTASYKPNTCMYLVPLTYHTRSNFAQASRAARLATTFGQARRLPRRNSVYSHNHHNLARWDCANRRCPGTPVECVWVDACWNIVGVLTQVGDTEMAQTRIEKPHVDQSRRARPRWNRPLQRGRPIEGMRARAFLSSSQEDGHPIFNSAARMVHE
eukprot:scaffold254559_cov32-Tisochrysis_lutea.AAC.4